MKNKTDKSRLTAALEMVRLGHALSANELLFSGEGNDVLCITGWTNTVMFENINRDIATTEIHALKTFVEKFPYSLSEMLKISGKKELILHLNYNYETGSVQICSLRKGTISWNIN